MDDKELSRYAANLDSIESRIDQLSASIVQYRTLTASRQSTSEASPGSPSLDDTTAFSPALRKFAL